MKHFCAHRSYRCSCNLNILSNLFTLNKTIPSQSPFHGPPQRRGRMSSTKSCTPASDSDSACVSMMTRRLTVMDHQVRCRLQQMVRLQSFCRVLPSNRYCNKVVNNSTISKPALFSFYIYPCTSLLTIIGKHQINSELCPISVQLLKVTKMITKTQKNNLKAERQTVLSGNLIKVHNM